MAIWNAASSAGPTAGPSGAAATPAGLQSGMSSDSLSLASFSQLVEDPGEVRRALRGVAPPLTPGLARADSGVLFSSPSLPCCSCSLARLSLAMGGRRLPPGAGPLPPPDSRRTATSWEPLPLGARLSRDTCGGRVLTATGQGAQVGHVVHDARVRGLLGRVREKNHCSLQQLQARHQATLSPSPEPLRGVAPLPNTALRGVKTLPPALAAPLGVVRPPAAATAAAAMGGAATDCCARRERGVSPPDAAARVAAGR